MKKRIYIIITILIVLLLSLIIYNKFRMRSLSQRYEYFDTTIIINIKTTNKNGKKIFKNIDEILKKYNILTDKYNEYEGINNLYFIKHNFLNDDYLTLDSELYNLIKYGLDTYEQSDGFIDISKGNLNELWRGYRISKIGVPTTSELSLSSKSNIDDIVLKEKNKIKNNHVNIDLNYIIKGYMNSIIKKYLEKNNIDDYTVNIGDSIVVGKHEYSIGLQNPNDENSIYKVLKESDKAISTTGNYQEYYEYNDKKYHNIINPKTLNPADLFKSVTVISNDPNKSERLSKMLFMISMEDGRKQIQNMSDVEVIWYTNDDKIIIS